MKSFGMPACSYDMENYDPNIAKMRSSISWLLSLSWSLSDSSKSQTLTENNHFEHDGSLTAESERLITSGVPYRNVISYIFVEQEHCGSFADMLEILNYQRKYFVTKEELALMSQQLVAIPVHVDAHLQLIDTIMRAVSSEVWVSVSNVVNILKRFPNFVASKELPNDYENAVVMWLAKVNQKLQEMEQSWQQISTDSRSFPTISRHLDDLCDSCVLTSTLHYYCPHLVSLNDIVLKETMSIADALHNLTLSLNFCYEELFPSLHEYPTNFLTPDDFIHCNESLRVNFFVFFSFLFYCVEINPDPRLVRPRGNESDKAKLNYPSGEPGNRIPSRSANHDGNTSNLTSTLPDVKSLISEVTKRSFNPDRPSSFSSFPTASSCDSADVHSVSTFSAIPHVPLLPRRHPEESSRSQDVGGYTQHPPSGQFSDVRLSTVNGAGDGRQARTKWTTRVQPFQLSPDVGASTDSTISVTHREKHHLHYPVSSLLSKVDVDDDLTNLLSERTYNVEVPGLSSDLAWEGFEPGRFHHSNRSSLFQNDEDLRLETVRTVENNSPHPTSIPKFPHHFQARPFLHDQHPMASSSSDLTVITTDFAGSEVSSSLSSREDVESTALSDTSKDFHSKSGYHFNQHKAPPPHSLQASYTVTDPTVSSRTSAKAAGYPIIDKSVDPHDFARKPSSAPFNGVNEVDTGTRTSPDVGDCGLTQPMTAQVKVIRWADYRVNSRREDQQGIEDEISNNGQAELLKRLELIANERRNVRSEEIFVDERKRQGELRVRSNQCLCQIGRWRLASKQNHEEKNNNATCTPMTSGVADLVTPAMQGPTPLRHKPDTTRSISDSSSSTLKDVTPGHVTYAPGTNDTSKVVLHETPVNSSVAGSTRPASCRELFSPKAFTKHKGAPPEAHQMTESYNTFLHQVKLPSCHSTPAKTPPASPPDPLNKTKEEDGADKKVLGFTILDERSPASELAKKKEQFLLGRVRKEEELRQKQMEREAEAERKKTEAREQHEKALLKKQEEKKKREKIFKEYQKRKQKEETTKQQAGVIGENMNGSHKQHHRSRTNSQHNVNLDTLSHFDTSPTPLGLTIPISSNQSSNRMPLHHHLGKDNDSDSTGSGSSNGVGSEYTGPKLYKQLSSKSNRILISNALNHCCLSGKVNDEKRSKASQALESSEDHHFMVLFRDQQCQFRGLYSYHVREEKLRKIYGSGPSVIKPWMIESLFKYNSGRRAFSCVASKTLAVSIDAITIKNSFWNHSTAKK